MQLLHLTYGSQGSRGPGSQGYQVSSKHPRRLAMLLLLALFCSADVEFDEDRQSL